MSTRFQRTFLLVALSALFGVVAVSAETHIVQMTTIDFEPQFSPADLSIRIGDTVQWVNVDPYLLDHGTTSGTGSADPLAGQNWDSGLLSVGGSYTRSFDQLGDFEYFSKPHEVEGMFGVIHVVNTTSVPHTVTESTWSAIKSSWADILPRD
jgi:plastocyanin